MVGWHHRLDGPGFGWTPGVGDGQGGLAYCGSGVTKSWTIKRAEELFLTNCGAGKNSLESLGQQGDQTS